MFFPLEQVTGGLGRPTPISKFKNPSLILYLSRQADTVMIKEHTPSKRTANGSGLKPVQFIGFDANKNLVIKEEAAKLLMEFGAKAR